MFLLRTIFIGTLFVSSTAFAQSATTSFSQKSFTDVPTNSVNYQAIEYLRSQSVLKGYVDGTFRPETRINRAEFIEFIINPFILDTNGRGDCVRVNLPAESKTVYFSDVPRSAWYADNVCFSKQKQIIDGYPDNTFRPGDPINFVEAAKIISNVFSLNVDTYQRGEFWYHPYVQSLSDLHAIPTSITTFGGLITRGEMAQIVFRLKADSTIDSYMVFDAGRNTLSARVQTAPVVTPVDVVQQPHEMISRPSRRSIIADAEERNRLRR